MFSRKLTLSTVLSLSMAGLCSQAGHAKPDLTTPVDMQLLHHKESGYRFVTQHFNQPAPTLNWQLGDMDSASASLTTPLRSLATPASPLQQYAKPRNYQVWLAIPDNYRPDNPDNRVLYLLDGNAVIDELDTDILRALAKLDTSQSTPSSAPVLVMIGYQTPYRFDIDARAYDYTPPLLKQSATMFVANSASMMSAPNSPPSEGTLPAALQPDAFKEKNRDRLNGGAEHFVQLIESQIKPWVYQQLGGRPKVEGLWGHSYGGLFVLYNLFTHPQAYDYYFSADPSLWWQNSEIIRYWQDYQQVPAAQQPPAKQLQIRLTFSNSQGADAQMNKADFAQAICTHFAEQCRSQSYEQSHGELFPTSLKLALQQFDSHRQQL